MIFFSAKTTFNGNCRITDRDFVAELGNPSTTEYQTLKNELQPGLQQELCDESYSCKVTITDFSNGSIVCDFEIEVESALDPSTLETNLESKLTDLNIPTFDITPGTISPKSFIVSGNTYQLLFHFEQSRFQSCPNSVLHSVGHTVLFIILVPSTTTTTTITTATTTDGGGKSYKAIERKCYYQCKALAVSGFVRCEKILIWHHVMWSHHPASDC